MSEEKNKTAFIGGLLLGGSIGAIASIFLAPRSGKENRQILKKNCPSPTRNGRRFILYPQN